MLVLPRRGYGHIASHEGEVYARWLNALGLLVYVLEYRLGVVGHRIRRRCAMPRRRSCGSVRRRTSRSTSSAPDGALSERSSIEAQVDSRVPPAFVWQELHAGTPTAAPTSQDPVVQDSVGPRLISVFPQRPIGRMRPALAQAADGSPSWKRDPCRMSKIDRGARPMGRAGLTAGTRQPLPAKSAVG
ncbi:MAG: hypothetical protein IT457_17615 [Planctomycetes bacterium]|nr:hypothetical protein [Planctomycetota bacterium]